MRLVFALPGTIALLLTSIAHAAPPPVVRPTPAVTPVAAPRRAPTTTPSHAAVSAPEHEAPHGAPAPSTLHLAPAPAAPKATDHLVEFVKEAWTTKAPSLNYKPYRSVLGGESLPSAVESARGEAGASVFVVNRGPDQIEKRVVSMGGGRFAEREIKVAGPELKPENRLYIVRRNFTTTIFDAEGKVVAAGADQTPGHGADFMHSSSTDWNKATRSATPASLPPRNPEVRPSGGGSFAYTVPLAGSANMRVQTRDPGSFYEGGAETTSESDWGGRLIISQPYAQLPGGKSMWVPPKVVNVKSILDSRTGKPVDTMMALEVDGRSARYEPRTHVFARPDLSLDAYRQQWKAPGPLF